MVIYDFIWIVNTLFKSLLYGKTQTLQSCSRPSYICEQQKYIPSKFHYDRIAVEKLADDNKCLWSCYQVLRQFCWLMSLLASFWKYSRVGNVENWLISDLLYSFIAFLSQLFQQKFSSFFIVFYLLRIDPDENESTYNNTRNLKVILT